jgi:predicted Zn-dependent protease
LNRLCFYVAIISTTLMVLAGCVTNPITGRSQAMTVSDEQAAQKSQAAYNQLLQEAQTDKVLDEDTSQVRRIQEIANPLIAQAEKLRPATNQWAWEVHVLKSPEVNAWCMAGGKMAVYTGLLDKIQPTDDELAAVLGHEIAHALLSHQAEKMSRSQMQNASISVGLIAASMMGYGMPGMGALANSAASVGLELPNSRESESEADSVGLRLAAQAGFNPEASVSLWQKMLAVSSNNQPTWLSTHPDPESRISAMQVEAQKLMPVYETAKKPKPKSTSP